MSGERVETKITIEDNNLYKIKYYYTDNHWIDHSIITFEWKDYIIRYKKKDINDIKTHIIEYMRKYRKNNCDENMPFRMWLKNFKWFYR